MDTCDQSVGVGRRRRRRRSGAFKAEAVAASRQPGVSIAAIALARGLNANLLRRWVSQAERTGRLPVPARPPTASAALEDTRSFVPVPLPSGATERTIRIEVRRGSTTLSVQWPASAARACARLLRELMR